MVNSSEKTRSRCYSRLSGFGTVGWDLVGGEGLRGGGGPEMLANERSGWSAAEAGVRVLSEMYKEGR